MVAQDRTKTEYGVKAFKNLGGIPYRWSEPNNIFDDVR